MELQNIIKELQDVMHLDFDERAISFSKYRDLLTSEIASNPSNIEAYCLLAMIICELREETEKSIDILEQCYAQNQSSFSDQDYILWATDLAYFLLEECGEENEDRAVQLLVSSIDHHSTFSETYYGYGKYFFIKKDFKKAANLFHRAFELFPKKSYKFCEASSLLASSQQQEGISLLKSIYTYPFEGDELNAKIALTLGRELALSGDKDEAQIIADLLLKSDDIEMDQVADILYILGDYQTFVELYDECKLLEYSSWLNMYFYALKQTGEATLAEKKLQEVTQKIEKELLEEEITDWESMEDYQEYISSENSRLQTIKEGYQKVFTDCIEIPPDIYYEIFYECYYIHCPRHSSK